MQLPERKRVRTLPCPCPRALCSALPLGRGMIPALDHLLVRLLIIQPWIGTQALGLGHFGHPPLGHLQHVRGLSLSLRVGVQSSQVTIVTLLSRLRTVSQADGGAEAEAALITDYYKSANVHRSSRLARHMLTVILSQPHHEDHEASNGRPTDLLPLTK